MEYIKTPNEEIEKDAWLYSLRKNNILIWVAELESVTRFSDILNTCPVNSTLEIESGIVKIEPNGRYIGHQFVPHVNAGFGFSEISILLRSRIIEFEDEYGKINLSEKDLHNLRQLVYQFNRQVPTVDISDKNKLNQLEQSAEVLYYLLSRRIILDTQGNGCCSLIFTLNNNSRKDYCTIFTEEQIALLKRVNNSILPETKLN